MIKFTTNCKNNVLWFTWEMNVIVNYLQTWKYFTCTHKPHKPIKHNGHSPDALSRHQYALSTFGLVHNPNSQRSVLAIAHKHLGAKNGTYAENPNWMNFNIAFNQSRRLNLWVNVATLKMCVHFPFLLSHFRMVPSELPDKTNKSSRSARQRTQSVCPWQFWTIQNCKVRKL